MELNTVQLHSLLNVVNRLCLPYQSEDRIDLPAEDMLVVQVGMGAVFYGSGDVILWFYKFDI